MPILFILLAVKLHPDKFPNDANAADKFHQLVTAKDILTDENLRQKYDALIKAKLARIERENRRTSKQREMMDKLLAGEEAHRKQREAERFEKKIRFFFVNCVYVYVCVFFFRKNN